METIRPCFREKMLSKCNERIVFCPIHKYHENITLIISAMTIILQLLSLNNMNAIFPDAYIDRCLLI